jgi:hypothetical protein
LGLDAVHVLPDTAVQLLQLYDVGDCVHVAVSVVVPPAYGLVGFALSVHVGGAVGGTCQATDTVAVGPKPEALRAEML